MDTKLKNSNRGGRKIACLVSGIICVIAATVATVTAMALLNFYEIGYGYLYDADGAHFYIENIYKIEGLQTLYRATVSQIWMIEVAALIITAVSQIASFIFTGSRDSDGKVEQNWFDRWFTEFQLVLGGCVTGGIIGLAALSEGFLYKMGSYQSIVAMALSGVKHPEEIGQAWTDDFIPFEAVMILCIAGLIICYAAGVMCLDSIAKKIKAKTFWKHTILGALVIMFWNAFKESDDITLKVMALCLAGAVLSATWLGFVPVIILICIFVPKWLKQYRSVKNGINELRQGNLDYKIEVKGNGELDRLAASVNEISQATKIAVENENKSTRMKTDLISNVSHDIKTPLTSMITYVDLLKVEGLDSPNAPEYLRIVDEKTQRLKKLTEDLFDAAKASSGAMPVDIQQLELVSLINQALAETEERFGARNLNVIFSNKADSVHVMADGQLLWRVMENLFVNASKYALAGSRVYVDLIENGENLTVEVKNMSEAQLNISADELMERFQRGDASRNTEGSGLGLSIARDLTELMNGEFAISVDGDLFKASVTLKKTE